MMKYMKKMNQSKVGRKTEFESAEYFSKKGYWVYQCPNTQAGQPADLIVAKDNKITLVEVKHCKNNRFTLNRIEPNQITAYRFFKSKGNKSHKILIKFKDGVYLMDFTYIEYFKSKGIKSITIDVLNELGERLNE